MPQVTEAEVFRACRTLFGPELNLNHDFLAYLQPSGVRSAYRKQAKIVHPDRYAVSGSQVQARQHRLFQDLNAAHQTVLDYLKHGCIPSSTYRGYSQPRHSPPKPRKDPPQYRNTPGHLPRRPLQFGLFLYHLKIIPFNEMVAAVIWQRQQRPKLGEIGRSWGWLDDNKIRTILTSRYGLAKFGEKAERLGILTPQQIRTMLFFQRSKQPPMGRYFVERGFLNESTLEDLLQQLAEHNRTYDRSFSGQFYYYHHK